jgi:Guanylate-binding protein, N-terminal domain
MGHPLEELTGFSWGGGCGRVTTGIIMWSDVFLHTDKISGAKIAIILLDTHGLFDNLTTPTDNSRIFGLSSLLSSVLIFNIGGQIQEDQIEYLQAAVETTRRVMSNTTTFQNVLFLIRDWENSENHAYGLDGGENYLENYLKIDSGMEESLKKIRQYMTRHFPLRKCYLLPHPGLVARKIHFQGQLEPLETDFKDHLQNLIEYLFDPDRQSECFKTVRDCEVIGKEMYLHMSTLFDLFKCGNVPETQTVYDVLMNDLYAIYKTECLNHYEKSMKPYLRSDLNVRQFAEQHEIFQTAALSRFAKNFNREDIFKTKIKLAKLKKVILNSFKTFKDLHKQILKETAESTSRSEQFYCLEYEKRMCEQALKDAEFKKIVSGTASAVGSVVCYSAAIASEVAVGSAIAVVAAPVAIVAGAATGVGAVGYFVYDHFNRKKKQEMEELKLKQSQL